MPEGISKEGMGHPFAEEDKKFITGKGRYTDDINRAGQVYAYFVRSDAAHAEIAKINTSAAMKADGVVMILQERMWQLMVLAVQFVAGWYLIVMGLLRTSRRIQF